jgi:hypothetical protein
MVCPKGRNKVWLVSLPFCQYVATEAIKVESLMPFSLKLSFIVTRKIFSSVAKSEKGLSRTETN